MKGEGSGNSPGHSQKAERLVEWNKTNPTDPVDNGVTRSSAP